MPEGLQTLGSPQTSSHVLCDSLVGRLSSPVLRLHCVCFKSGLYNQPSNKGSLRRVCNDLF